MKTDRIDDFLRTAKPRKIGAPCRTCSHHRRAAVDVAIRKFAAAREKALEWDGSGDMPEGATALRWSDFHRFLVDEFDLATDPRSVRKHALDCLGVDVVR